MAFEAEPRCDRAIRQVFEVGERAVNPRLGPIGVVGAHPTGNVGERCPDEGGRAQRFGAVLPPGELVTQVDPAAVDTSDGGHSIGVTASQFEHHVPAPGLARDDRSPQTQRVDEPGEIIGDRAGCVAVVRLVGTTVAAQVHGDGAVAGGRKLFCHAIPKSGVRCQSVDEHEGLSRSLLAEYTEPHSGAGVDELVTHRRPSVGRDDRGGTASGRTSEGGGALFVVPAAYGPIMFLAGSCGGCGALGWAVCPGCARALQRATPPPVAGLDWCGALVRYEGVGRQLVGALKFRGNRAALLWWGERLAAALPGQPATVTWAPTSPSRRRRRGFDQAAALAKATAAMLGVRGEGLLDRSEAPSQTGRSAVERAHGPSFVLARCAPAGQILVIDDVLTTGATLSAAAAALRKQGADEVWGLTAAWTP